MSAKKTKKTTKKKGWPYFSLLGFIILILILSLFNLIIYFSSTPKQILGLRMEVNTNSVLETQKEFWNKLLSKNPTYVDGWMELAKIEVQLENIDNAKKAIDRAKKIEPNSKSVSQVEIDLGLTSK